MLKRSARGVLKQLARGVLAQSVLSIATAAVNRAMTDKTKLARQTSFDRSAGSVIGNLD